MSDRRKKASRKQPQMMNHSDASNSNHTTGVLHPQASNSESHEAASEVSAMIAELKTNPSQ
jgi:hypothetical protein